MQNKRQGNVQGIDVSHWQGSIDWNRVKASGQQFAFIKATEGKSYRDKQFLNNVKGARAAGLLVGAYHFVNAVNVADAKLEAANFVGRLQEAGGAERFELPPVMDYENNPSNLNKSTINAVALAFLQEVERLSGRKPIVYTGNAFAQNFTSALNRYDLWIARYSNTRVPDDAPAWKEWNFWQYTDSGQVGGINGGVDLNVYNGTLDELKTRYAISEGTKPTTFPAPENRSRESTVTYVNGNSTKAGVGMIIDNKNYVPIRDLEDVFGFTAGFNHDSKVATINGRKLQDGRLIGSTTYVQAAVLVRAFEGELEWNNEKKILTIIKGGN